MAIAGHKIIEQEPMNKSLPCSHNKPAQALANSQVFHVFRLQGRFHILDLLQKLDIARASGAQEGTQGALSQISC